MIIVNNDTGEVKTVDNYLMELILTYEPIKYKFKNYKEFLNLSEEIYVHKFDLSYDINNKNNKLIDSLLFDLFKVDIDNLKEFYTMINNLSYDDKLIVLFMHNESSYITFKDLQNINHYRNQFEWYQFNSPTELANELYSQGRCGNLPEWTNHKYYDMMVILGKCLLQEGWVEYYCDGNSYYYHVK